MTGLSWPEPLGSAPCLEARKLTAARRASKRRRKLGWHWEALPVSGSGL